MNILTQQIGMIAILTIGSFVFGQPYGLPDRENPGDEMIQAYLNRLAEEVHSCFSQDIESLDQWQKQLPEYRKQYLYMLGLWPMPDKTPLQAAITGTLSGNGYQVDLLHFQSRPGLYVTANLYRPSPISKESGYPAVLYVCGHAGRGRNGNKTAFQSHGIWFARHGYLCLILDTLQLGEIAAIHHGTYRENRWWWHSRGYTPAGVECLNGIRGIDYLISRSDVDPDRIAVTGISGGGAATFWIAAADERVKVAVPVSGMADLPSYVGNRVINGHCDCMFLYNTFQWPWTRIAALIAPRPLLFTNSDQDTIFPMDANERIICRLERIYSMYGASDLVDSMVSIGGHAYRKDLRQAEYRFINMHLKGNPQIVTDSEIDLVTGSDNQQFHPINPEKLRVFPEDKDIPVDQLNTTIDRYFVLMADVKLPEPGTYPAWKQGILTELRQVTFRGFPEKIPSAVLLQKIETGEQRFSTEPGIEVYLTRNSQSPENPSRVLLIVQNSNQIQSTEWLESFSAEGDEIVFLSVRGVGKTQWTRKNPPNYVERAHALLGCTVDTGRVWDIIAMARYLRNQYPEETPLYIGGQGRGGILAAYAALLESDIQGVILNQPPLSHMDPDAPQFLNVLRVCDIPDVLGMLAPNNLVIFGEKHNLLKKTSHIYDLAGAQGQFHLLP
ncbi:MAG: prolyl oligopeptidase family serine peptidase [Sedimentisphaerales bacterium]|nr:prolyl oligopeptidase family serine peptidase [Sedimentisphaerales bacterium]